MTLVLGMRFSPKSGILIVDEQTSTPMRKTEIADKIYEDGERPLPGFITGGSGSSDVIYRTVLEYSQRPESGPRAFNEAARRVKHEVVDDHFRLRYGVGVGAFYTGLLPGTDQPVSRSLMERMERFFDSNGAEISDFLQNGFVILEPSDMSLSIAGTGVPSVLPIPRPYVAIGSGSDSAEISMSQFYDRISRERRFALGFTEGMRGAIKAADEASKRNMGVGGVPSMAIIKDGAFYRPSQRNSRLAVEIVRSDNEGLISDGFVDEALEEIVEDPGSFAKVNHSFIRAAKDTERLALFLRGYIE